MKTVHWFRKGLRIHDNPALVKAIEASSEIYPVFCLDPFFVKSNKIGINRWRFLIQSLKDLDEQLKKLNLRLFLVKGKPEIELPLLCSKWSINLLTYEVDTEPYAVQRDEKVDEELQKLNVEVFKCVSHTLYDIKKTIKENGGTAPLTYQRLQTVLAKIGPPPKPLPTPTLTDVKNITSTINEEHENNFGVPTLEDLGKSASDCGPLLYPGGETEALQRMERHIKKVNWICSFEKPNTSPNSLSPSTTVLSPYLKFGCLSARLFYHKLAEVYRNQKHSKPPVSLHGQMLWREFFYTAAAATPNFDRMVGNPVCRQIPWELNQGHLDAWTHGRTGYPFIDAIMRQLRTEGWIHHLARHAVACFLTRGDLWISWEEGQKVFEELLLDADWSLNAGNWMWLSASAFFHQYFRVYSPVAFGKKTDPDGSYIKKYVPELKNFPTKFIYEPWKAPESVGKAAGCIVGKDYPLPIVYHDIVRDVNIKKMAAAYEACKANSNSPSSSNKRKLKSPTQEKRTKKRK